MKTHDPRAKVCASNKCVLCTAEAVYLRSKPYVSRRDHEFVAETGANEWMNELIANVVDETEASRAIIVTSVYLVTVGQSLSIFRSRLCRTISHSIRVCLLKRNKHHHVVRRMNGDMIIQLICCSFFSMPYAERTRYNERSATLPSMHAVNPVESCSMDRKTKSFSRAFTLNCFVVSHRVFFIHPVELNIKRVDDETIRQTTGYKITQEYAMGSGERPYRCRTRE